MNPEIVGRSVKTIANLAGLEKVPATARVLVAKETGVGRGHPYSNEKLGPSWPSTPPRTTRRCARRSVRSSTTKRGPHLLYAHQRR